MSTVRKTFVFYTLRPQATLDTSTVEVVYTALISSAFCCGASKEINHMRPFPWVLLVLAAFAVGCAQSAPTSPSQTGNSEDVSVTAQAAAPGASYNAGGSWHFRAIARWQNGAVFNDEGDITFTQDVDGNLHGTTGNAQLTLTRLGSGRTIAYRMSVFEPHTGCNTELSGTAQIHTATDLLQAKLAGIEQNCERAEVSVQAFKNP